MEIQHFKLEDAIRDANSFGFHIVGWNTESKLFHVYHPVEPPKNIHPHFLCIKNGKKPIPLDDLAKQMWQSLMHEKSQLFRQQ